MYNRFLVLVPVFHLAAAWFTLNGNVNSQSNVCCCPSNPRVFHKFTYVKHVKLVGAPGLHWAKGFTIGLQNFKNKRKSIIL
jgi:hypothetical protein